MSKRKKSTIPLGTAAALSVVSAFGIGLVSFIVLWILPNNPLRNLVELIVADPSPTVRYTQIYADFEGRIDLIELFVVSPLASIIGGFVLGRLMGDDFGPSRLYRWALGCAVFFYSASIVAQWLPKLIFQNMRLLPGDITAQWATAQLFGLVLWIGLYVVGAELGRRLRTMKVRPAATA